MCNQAVSLVAAEIEKSSIPTVVLQLLCDVAEKMGPPRALCVPFRHGFPLGAAGDPEKQKDVLKSAIALLESAEVPRTIVHYER
jgi:hypothetical protein